MVKLKGNLLWSTQTLPYTTPKPTTPRAPGQRHQHHLHQSPMHALLWALGAAVTILLLGGIIATYHHYAGVAHSRAAEQREQRFLADASELEQLRGGPARRDASLLDLFRYRYCKSLLTFHLPLVPQLLLGTEARSSPPTTRYAPQRQERVVLHRTL